ncbi:MAG: hypothetical protein WCA77_01150 [Thermoplasmata archaeon]
MSVLAAIVILAALAVGMVVTTGVLLKWTARTRTQLRAMVIIFLLVMMTGMLLGAALYFVSPSPPSLIDGLWVAAGLMSASVLLVFFEFLRETGLAQGADSAYVPSQVRRPAAFAAAVIGTVILNEILMGWTFQRAAGGPVWLGGYGIENLLAYVFVSPWFVFPMALEMILTVAWLASEFPPPMLILLALQPVVMIFSPPTFPVGGWVVGSAVTASAVMACALAYVLRLLYRGEPLPGPVLGYATRLFSTFGVMAAGLAVWILSGNVVLFAFSVLLQMVVFLQAIAYTRKFALGWARPSVAAAAADPSATTINP